MDKGEGKQGQGVQTQDKMRKMENRERWLRRSRLTSHYTVGNHTEKRGDEAAVAFYPDLF